MGLAHVSCSLVLQAAECTLGLRFREFSVLGFKVPEGLGKVEGLGV